MAQLEGKRAVVTGAASGIGRATSLLFAAHGARLVIVDRTAEELGELAAEIEEAGGSVVMLTGDISDESTAENIVETCTEEFGSIDIYYANAGISGELLPLTRYSADAMQRVLAVNLLGPMLAIKHAAPAMIEGGGGSILMTASVAGLGGNAGPAVYSATKAGVINLAKSAASELIGTNVRVNAICPGLIETGMTRFLFDSAREKGTLEKVGQLNPLSRHGAPEEIAAAALFLAGEASSYVNGQAIVVDGGLSASLPFAPAHVLRAGH